MVTEGGAPVRVVAEVRTALAEGRPVVALESTVFSRLGLPPPANAEALTRCLAAVAGAGAVAAVTAVVDGTACIGLEEAALERVLAAATKVAGRDLPVAVASGWSVGATTVSASLALAALAGVTVFATGGIGGVHRPGGAGGDVSADLEALARHPVVTVCAGVKSFLDVPRTLERLETLGVPVLGLATDELPGFWSRRSGVPVPHRVDSPAAAAAVVHAGRGLGYPGGTLVAVPVPSADEVPAEEVEPVVASALADLAGAGITGGAVTPFVLERVAAATGGRTVRANVAAVEHSAAVAAALAVALAAAAGDPDGAGRDRGGRWTRA